MKSKLDMVNSDIDALSAKIDLANDTFKSDAKVKLRELKDRAGKLRDMIGAAEDNTAETWDKFKGDVNAGYTEIQKGIIDARQWLSDKIAP